MPFSLQKEVGESDTTSECNPNRVSTSLTITVQYWVSVLLAVYGAANFAASRK